MIIYYAHSKLKYNTKDELNEINIIKSKFNDSVIINPNGWIYECRNESYIMKQCLKFIDNSDILIFSSLDDGIIGRGVYDEIEHALKSNKEVYYLNEYIMRFTQKEFNNIKIIYETTKSWKTYAKVKIYNRKR